MASGPPDPGSAAARIIRARALVDEALARAGPEAIDHERLVAEHPGLEAELRRELGKLRLIEAARRDADATSDELLQVGADDPSPGPEATRVAAGGLRVDSFPGHTLRGELYRGGQGVVYRAVQKGTRREVAIKVMRGGPFAGPRDRMRFEREVEILGQLNHPNIVTIHETGTSGDATWFAMDYIPGKPLDAHVEDAGLGVRGIVGLVAEICDAVNVAHLRGIIHRDLKPSNIRVDPAGVPHVLDFGLAKLSADDPIAEHGPVMTVTGQFVGSLPWASPEQAAGAPGALDLRTDVYSLGVILYQLLTGRLPYDVTGGLRDVLARIIDVEPARPRTVRPDLDDDVETIVLRCLSKDAARRYQTAGDLARDLRHYLAREPIESKRDSTVYVIRKLVARHPAATAAVLAGAVLVIAFATTMTVLYRRATAAEQRAAGQASAALLALDGLNRIFLERRRKETSARELFDGVTAAALEGMTDHPRARALLIETVAAICDGYGYHDLEARWRLEAMRVHRDLPDRGERARADELHELGEALHQARLEAEAGVVLERALVMKTRTLGPDHAEVGDIRASLAASLQFQARWDEAEAAWREAVRIFHLGGAGTSRDDLPLALAGLAGLLDTLGRRDGVALTLATKAMELAAGLDGDGSEQAVATAHEAYVRGLLSAPRLDDALAVASARAEAMRDAVGREHPRYAAARELEGLALSRMGRHADAIMALDEAVEVRRGYEDDAALADALLGLAGACAAAGRYAEGELPGQETLRLHRDLYDDEHWFVGRAMLCLGRIYVGLERPADAEVLLRGAAEICEAELPVDHELAAEAIACLQVTRARRAEN